MPGLHSFDYAVVRVVPRVDRGEFLNAGVILFCRTLRYLGARIDLDEARLQVLAPTADLPVIRQHLSVIPLVCAGAEGTGPIGRLTQPERFHWLVSPRSTVIQTSPVHSGLCQSPADTLAQLMLTMVNPPRQDGER